MIRRRQLLSFILSAVLVAETLQVPVIAAENAEPELTAEVSSQETEAYAAEILDEDGSTSILPGTETDNNDNDSALTQEPSGALEIPELQAGEEDELSDSEDAAGEGILEIIEDPQDLEENEGVFNVEISDEIADEEAFEDSQNGDLLVLEPDQTDDAQNDIEAADDSADLSEEAEGDESIDPEQKSDFSNDLDISEGLIAEQEPETVQIPAMDSVDADITASGTCGENATWDLYADHTLIIRGSGEMTNYSTSVPAPWNEYKDSIYSVIIEEGITSVGSYSFYYYDEVLNVSLPDTLKTIYAYAFNGCIELTNVDLPDSITMLGACAFGSCTNLVSINIPSDIETIGGYAFSGCGKLSIDLIFPDSILDICEGAFNGCSSITKVVIPSSLTSIEDSVFCGCGISEIEIPSSITRIEHLAFSCTQIEELTIPENVKYLGEKAFEGCVKLERLSIMGGVEQIPAQCFKSCRNLRWITFHTGLKEIGQGAFAGCVLLGWIAIPDGATTINYSAFENCGLRVLRIPESVTYIGTYNDADYLVYCGSEKHWGKVENAAYFSQVYCISEYVTGAEIQKAEYVVGVGNQLIVKANIFPANATCNRILWYIDDPGTAAIVNQFADQSTCIVKGINPGSTILTGRTLDGQYEISCIITTTAAAVKGIELSCGSKTILGINRSKTIEAVLSPESVDNNNIIWSSSDESVMTVDDQGVISGISQGTAILTAMSEDGGYKATCTVTVYIPAESLTISEKDVTINKGETTILTANTTPDNAQYCDLTWTSSDPAVADFYNGVNTGNSCTIVAKNGGRATIEVMTADGELTESCEINVIVPLQSISIRKLPGTDTSSSEIGLRAGCALKITYSPADATDKTVEWSSSDPDVISVDNTGFIRGISLGTATITAISNDGGYIATCDLSVIIPLTNITIYPQLPPPLARGTQKTFNVAFTPNDATYKDIVWKTSDENIAKVDQNGTVTAINPGRAWITVTTVKGNYRSTIYVDVIVPTTGIKLDKNSVSIIENEEVSLIASVMPEDATNQTVSWSSSDESIVSVDQNGVITAIKPGEAVITASTANGEFTATCDVEVLKAITGFELDQSSLLLIEGKTAKLTAAVEPEDAYNTTVTWTSSDESIVTVDEEGNITAVKAGEAVITASTAGGEFTKTCDVEVLKAVTGIELDRSSLSLIEGKKAKLTAAVEPEDAYDTTVTWTTSDESIVTVDEEGNLTAVKPGEAVITASTAGGEFTKTCDVEVLKAITGFELDQSSLSLIEGHTAKLTAVVEPEDAYDTTVTWTTSDESIATVDEEGSLTAVKAGEAVITASTAGGEFTKTCDVEVLKAITGIELDYSSLSLIEGKTAKLTAAVEPEDAYDTTVTWTTSDESIVTVDQEGNLTAIKPGEAVITAAAADESFTAACSIKVLTAITEVALDKTEATLAEGETIKLTATVKPEDAYDKTVFWSSSDESVAAVDQEGSVTAVREGEAVITVSAAEGSVVNTCRVTVIIPVTGITISEKEKVLACGEEAVLLAEIAPDNATNKGIKWVSSNTDVVSVDQTGAITANEIGHAVVIAMSMDGYFVDSCEIDVTFPLGSASVQEIDSQTFDNQAIAPKPVVTRLCNDEEITLAEGKDYEIVYLNNVNAGEATINITGKGYYTGTISATFTIDPKPFNGTSVSGISARTYTGSAIKPAPEVKDGTIILKSGTDYTVTYSNNTNVGTATVTITGKGNYTGTKTTSFKINPKSVSGLTITGIAARTYTGSAITPAPEVKDGTKVLKSGTDYTAACSNNTNAGTATVTITGKGNYTGTKTATFKINPKSVSGLAATSIVARTYTGSAIKPVPEVKDGTKVLKSGTDYTTAYSNNTNAGTATVTITGKGNYTGTKKVTFKINKANQSITAKAAAASVAVGKTTTISVTGAKGTKSFASSNTSIAAVTSAGKVTAKKVGTVKITVTSAATANYNKATKTVTIKVLPTATTAVATANLATGIKVAWKKVAGATGYLVYRNNAQIKKITSGSTLTYTDAKANTNGAKYVYKIVAYAGTGTSTLSKSATTYRVAGPAITGIANSAASRMTVKWRRNARGTGYQIQYSLSKTFASGNKTVTIKNNRTVSTVIRALTKGKIYFVRVRAFKTVGGTHYFSAWSPTKYIKIVK